MNQESMVSIIKDQTQRVLWEIKNVIDSIPKELWNKEYCQMPIWKHVYHSLHSLDLWYINPRDKHYMEPSIHEKNLNNLDFFSTKSLNREEINDYYLSVFEKITKYVDEITDEDLLNYPEMCEYTRFTLILAQFRHLHSHMGMIMGFIISDTGKWPRVLGLENPIPEEYSMYF